MFAMLGEQLLAPCMPNEFYSCLEGQGQALPQGPGSSPVGCCGGTCSGGTCPTSFHTPIHCTRGAGPSFTLRPYVRAGAGFAMVQPPEAIIRGPQTSTGSGTQLRPRKGNSEVGTDLGPQVAPSLLVGTCTEACGFLWSQVRCGGGGRGLCSSLLLPHPVSPEDGASFLARSRRQGRLLRAIAPPRDSSLELSKQECHLTGRRDLSNTSPCFATPGLAVFTRRPDCDF